MLTQRRTIRIASLVVVWLSIFAPTLPTSARSLNQEISQYPADPPSGIPWSANFDGLSDVAAAFNQARNRENELLDTALTPMVLPNAAAWEEMSGGQKALWLINDERTVRGLAPLQSLEENVNEVAQDNAEWLLANNKFAHDADGRLPWERLDANAAISACHDFLAIAENLYMQGTTSSTPVPLIIEQAVYVMLYDDAGSQWGHRHAILWTPYIENSGAPDHEGFLGIGHAHGGYTNPFDGRYYQNTDIIVMNFFDPCATWAETTPVTPSPTPSPSPTPEETSTPPQQTRSVSGRITVPVAAGVSQGDGLAGVTIASEDGQTTLTNENGDFTLDGLLSESHTLTPSKEGYSFSPSSIEVDLSADDLSGINFMGSSGPTGTVLSFDLHLPLIMPRR